MADHNQAGGEEVSPSVDRRALLRQAGILAAGAAGVATAGVAWAPAAEAGVRAAGTGSKIVTVQPTRVVDTRIAAGRSNIVNRSGNLDSYGRLLAGHTIEIDVSNYVYNATAVFCNLTAVAPLSGGYLTLWPTGVRPATSSVNLLPNVTTANFALSGLSAADTVLLYAHATTHVLVDVTAFAVADQSNVNPSIRAGLDAPRPGPRAVRTPPAWYRPPR